MSSRVLSLLVAFILLVLCRGTEPAGASSNETEAYQLYQQAVALRKANRQVEALTCLNKAAALKPDWQTYHFIGLLYMEMKRYREAFSPLARAYGLAPAESSTVASAAECYYLLKDPDNAIALCTKYLAKYRTGDSIDTIWQTLGRCYAQKKQYAQSLDAFRNSLKADPANDFTWQAMCSDLSSDDAAAPQFKSVAPEFLKRFPNDSNAQYYKDRLKALDYSQARTRFEDEAVAHSKANHHDNVDAFVIVPQQFGGKVSPRFLAIVRQTIHGIPKTIWEPLYAYGYRVHVVPHVVDDFTDRDCKPEDQPRGYKKGATYKNVPALAMPHRKVLIVAQNYLNDEGKEETMKDPDHAMCHELGHAYDEYLGFLSKKMNLSEKYDGFSQSKAFAAAYESDAKKIEGKERETFSYYLQSGKAGQEELFANLFVFLWDNQLVEPGSHDDMTRAKFSNALKSISEARSLDPEYIRLKDLYDSHVKQYK